MALYLTLSAWMSPARLTLQSESSASRLGPPDTRLRRTATNVILWVPVCSLPALQRGGFGAEYKYYNLDQPETLEQGAQDCHRLIIVVDGCLEQKHTSYS
jgi:hypothetical protein